MVRGQFAHLARTDGVQDKHFFLIRRLVAEGAGEDESADNAFRVFAVNTYLKACADFLV